MGRAIVRNPKAFLMDEPLSNLDAKLRVQMRAEIARIQRDLGVTTIYVTHDQSEAMTLGDRVCVMRHGFLQQVDRPQVLYDRPANLFVASFIGSPAMNLVEAEVGDGVVTFGPHALRVDESVLDARPGLRRYAGRTVALGIRPEDVEDAAFAAEASADARLTVTVDIKEDMGSEVILHFAVDAKPVTTEAVAEVVTAEAIEAGVEQTHRHGTPFVARVERGTAAREGEEIELAVDTRRLHFFDLESGEGIYGEVAAPAPVAA
jgi:multiple sugar transport system ATP-binding protein